MRFWRYFILPNGFYDCSRKNGSGLSSATCHVPMYRGATSQNSPAMWGSIHGAWVDYPFFIISSKFCLISEDSSSSCFFYRCPLGRSRKPFLVLLCNLRCCCCCCCCGRLTYLPNYLGTYPGSRNDARFIRWSSIEAVQYQIKRTACSSNSPVVSIG